MNQPKIKKGYIKSNHLVGLVSLFIGLFGFYVVFSTLQDQLLRHRPLVITSFIIDVHLVVGLGLIYLSNLLFRKKRNALYVAVAALEYLAAVGVNQVLIQHRFNHISLIIFVRYILLPIIGIILLLINRQSFKVKSDQVAYRNSIKVTIIIFIVAILYGVIGFMLMDKSDFHIEIGLFSAIQHTLEQFNFFGNPTLMAYTRRAKLFMDSLTFVSFVSVIYIAISFFAPVRTKLIDQPSVRKKLLKIMEFYGADSEEYFKLWPHDKYYYFSKQEDAALAYGVKRGVAIVLSDPVGNKSAYKQLITDFINMAWSNDWRVSFVHVSDNYLAFYKDMGFKAQLIGQEAKLNIYHFVSRVATNKYFRNIINRFEKLSYTVIIYDPPYDAEFIAQLKVVSKDWLSKPGRSERGFVMGFFNYQYIQSCQIAVLVDRDKKIKAFMNLVPSSGFNKTESTYDMLRTASNAPPNSNDYLIYRVIVHLHDIGYKYFNMGLSPLVGLEESDNNDNLLITKVMRFAYINGDRFYSFKGLFRFKDKYEPEWENRYLLYKGGVRSFSKVLNSLLLLMKSKKS